MEKRFGEVLHTLQHAGIVLLIFSLLPALGFSQPRAFPGAQGFGAYTPGGRGGKVLFVTNLNDHGPGSLRAAVETPGPRLVLFRVAGVIELESTLNISAPYLTLAGQTAPGDGICLGNYGAVVRNTHDVIIRFLRVRPGDVSGQELDALSVYQSQNVILDHCSASWGTDETLSVTGAGADSVSVQWCFITESLNNSVHHKGAHGYGSLLRVDGNLSFHHNLYAHHNSRNPRPGTYGDMNRGGFVDFRNNVIYDWGSRAGYSAADKTTLNYVGNYLKPGPSTRPGRKDFAFSIGGAATSLFVAENLLEGAPEKNARNWQLIRIPKGLTEADVRIPLPLQIPPMETDPAGTVLDLVLTQAGANRPVRDPVDTRIVREVRVGSGHIIDSQKDVGGWPAYRSQSPLRDTDGDGMPDSWEQQYGLNPQQAASPHADLDGDGYTDLEEYLNGTRPDRKDEGG